MRLASAVVVLGLFCASCGDDEGERVGLTGTVVGGPCGAAASCAVGSVCQSSGDFPGGTCTVSCSTQAQCPVGTVCISEKSGICLLSCQTAAECREGYQCEAKSLEDGKGEARVCID